MVNLVNFDFNRMFRFLALFFVLTLTWSCSQYSTKPLAVAFHNINAKYNAIWQAERLEKGVKKKLSEEKTDNYLQTLPIISEFDSVTLKKYASEIDQIIKKASIAIDRHQNSHFIDDAYVLIGNGRILQHDYKNAIETFKYVNSIDHDEESQINSLISLYQIYIFEKDVTLAEKVAEIIQEQSLNKKQKINYYLSKAFLHQKKGENLIAIAIIEQTLPLMKSGNEKARLLYILGQLFQEEKKYSLASEYFKKVDKNKPSYDLQFHSKISNNALGGSLDELSRMLNEPKNQDNKALIYVAMGQIFYEKNDFAQAQYYWEKGAENNSDKGVLYLQLGDLFAKKIKKFDQAEKYYDSAATYLNSSHMDFGKAQRLKKVWHEFGALNQKINLEDSLMVLSTKSDEELRKIFEVMEARKHQPKDTLTLKKAIVQPVSTVTFTRRPSSPEQQSFYFYNDAVRIFGKQEFNNKWPNRNLEDHWNRKNKDQSLNSLSDIKPEKTLQNSDKKAENDLAKTDKFLNSGDPFLTWLSKIPRTELEKNKLQKRQESAVFDLGKFSKLEINDNELANSSFLRLLKEFPNTSFEPEALYLLYLTNLNDVSVKKKFKQNLFEKYPESHFKSLILKMENGNLSEGKEILAQKAYEKAYFNYQSKKFSESYLQCLEIEQQFPGSNLDDKISFLKALNKGEQRDLVAYENMLKIFLQTFPKSPLSVNARDLLNAINQNKR
jgi:tetratricopeptide (TPR) repeat protein